MGETGDRRGKTVEDLHDDRGLPPVISHPSSADPGGMLGALQEPSAIYTAVAGCFIGAFAVIAAWTLYVHNREKPPETTLIIVGVCLVVMVLLAWKLAAHARDKERDKQRQQRDELVKARIDEQAPAVAGLRCAKKFLEMIGGLNADELSVLQRIAEAIPDQIRQVQPMTDLHRKEEPKGHDIIQVDGRSSMIWISGPYHEAAKAWLRGIPSQ